MSTNPRGNRAGRKANDEYRAREYLTRDEVDSMMKAARKRGRYPHRDATLILLAFRHAFRVGELVRLRWDHVDLKAGTILAKRLKGGVDSVHPLLGDEIRALRKLPKDSPYLFTTERKGPMTDQSARYVIREAGKKAKLPFPTHPHSLRHGTGFYLANKGIDTRRIQQFMGHRSIQSTVVYTQLAPGSFKDMWEE